jgi:hypothetical protein
MKLTRRNLIATAALPAAFSVRNAAAAQPQGSPSQPYYMDFTESGEDGGPPAIATLASGEILFKITTIQKGTGDISGRLVERITQIHPPDDERTMPITTLWRLETSQGVLEGHYSGMWNSGDDQRAGIFQMGEVLTVPRAYGYLYRAEAVYTATLEADRVRIRGALWFRRRS